MATPDRFDEFVVAGSHRLLPTALELTGDPALAEELVQTALASARPGWRRIEDNPEPHLQRIMEATLSSRWRRRMLAAGAGTPARGSDRLAGVRHRLAQRRARRRRIAAGSVVGLLLIIGYVAMPAGRSPTHRVDPSTPPASPLVMASPIALIEGFPEYSWGAKIIGAAVESLPKQRLVLTVVPTTTDLVWFERCDYTDPTAPDAQLEIDLQVNGHPLAGGGCGGVGRPSDWSGLGVRLGEPATFIMTVRGAQQFDQQKQRTFEVPVRGTGSIGFAVGERVAFADFPLPARPITLPPLEDPGFNGTESGTFAIRNDPADPTRPVSTTFAWPGDVGLNMISQTPGYLRVSVDGVDVVGGEWWDYKQGTWGGSVDEYTQTEGFRRPKKGKRVTITVRPEHVTGDWMVNVWPQETS